MYDGIVQDLIDEFGRLPGIGPKSAQRLALHVVQNPDFDVSRLGHALLTVRERVRYCTICGNVGEREVCAICADPSRSHATICVVEEPKDIAAIERMRDYRGVFHVLGGSLNPMAGIGPDQLNLPSLMRRLQDDTVQEVIIATDPNIEGEATATYLIRTLAPLGINVTRLAHGLPMGGDLEYADELTLGRAFQARTKVQT